MISIFKSRFIHHIMFQSTVLAEKRCGILQPKVLKLISFHYFDSNLMIWHWVARIP